MDPAGTFSEMQKPSGTAYRRAFSIFLARQPPGLTRLLRTLKTLSAGGAHPLGGDYCFFSGFVAPLPHDAPEAPLQHPPDLPAAAVEPPLLQQPAAGWFELFPHDSPPFSPPFLSVTSVPGALGSAFPRIWPTAALRWDVAAADFPCCADSCFFSTVSVVAFSARGALSV